MHTYQFKATESTRERELSMSPAYFQPKAFTPRSAEKAALTQTPLFPDLRPDINYAPGHLYFQTCIASGGSHGTTGNTGSCVGKPDKDPHGTT